MLRSRNKFFGVIYFDVIDVERTTVKFHFVGFKTVFMENENKLLFM